MQITKHNFQESLPRVRSLIEAASFISWDCEMTGLFVDNNSRDHPLDSYSERYSKLLASAQQFAICQFGLSCWTWNGAAWEASSLNFYLFPFTSNAQDSRFLCQASSLQFLASVGFDFNRFVYDGIPYGSLQQRDRKLQALQQPEPGKAGSNHSQRPSSTAQASQQQPPSTPPQPLNTTPTETTAATAGQPGADSVGTSSSDSQGGPVLTHASQLHAQIHGAAGFSAIWELMLCSGKPLVAHNPTFDLAYSLQLFQGPLPDTWPAYKALLSQLLQRSGARLFDTKHLALQLGDRAVTGGSTALGPLYQALSTATLPPTVAGRMPAALHAPGYLDYSRVPASVRDAGAAGATAVTRSNRVDGMGGEEGGGDGDDSSSDASATAGPSSGVGPGAHAHEAGYDAFMTGAIFVKLLALFEAKATGATASLLQPTAVNSDSQLRPQLSLDTALPRQPATPVPAALAHSLTPHTDPAHPPSPPLPHSASAQGHSAPGLSRAPSPAAAPASHSAREGASPCSAAPPDQGASSAAPHSSLASPTEAPRLPSPSTAATPAAPAPAALPHPRRDPLSTSLRHISAHQQRTHMGNSELPHWEFGQAADPTIPRPNVFYVPNLRLGMRPQEVAARFASAGLGRVTVKMVPARRGQSGGGALVELQQPPQNTAWVVHSIKGWKLMTYAQYVASEHASSSAGGNGSSGPANGSVGTDAGSVGAQSRAPPAQSRAPPKTLPSSPPQSSPPRGANAASPTPRVSPSGLSLESLPSSPPSISPA
ncbi:MAG: hypothetical protein WDW38_002425 [Sanguina aurantia]